MYPILSGEQGKRMPALSGRRAKPAIYEKRVQQSKMAARLTHAGAWTSLPEELENHIMVVAIRDQALTSWRLIMQDVIWLHALGARPVLVQSGGPPDLRFSQLASEESQEGAIVTLEMVRITQCHEINQELMVQTCNLGERAVALSGIDGQMVQAHRSGLGLGAAAHIQAVDPHLVEVLCAQGYLPIVGSLGQGPDGTTLFIDGEHFATHLACALDAEMLVVLDNAPGVRRCDGSLIAALDESEGRWLLEEGAIASEQIPLLSACLGALVAVPRVHIADGDEPHTLLHLCLGGLPKGTRLIRDPAPVSSPGGHVARQQPEAPNN